MKFKRFLSCAFFVLAFISFSYVGVQIKKQNSQIEVEVSKQNAQVQPSNLLPTLIKIEQANIELPITKATITNNRWEYVDKGVGYLDLSPTPGSQGNSIIYGHNWNNILGNLKKVQTGDLIEITFSDNTKKIFEVSSKFIVTPDQTHILNQTTEHKLTIYTCTGFLDSKRLVVTAKLI